MSKLKDWEKLINSSKKNTWLVVAGSSMFVCEKSKDDFFVKCGSTEPLLKSEIKKVTKL